MKKKVKTKYIHSLSEVNRGLIFSSKNFNLLTNWKTWTGWAHNNSQTFSGSLGGCTSFSSSKTGWCFSKYLKDKSKQTMKPDFSITYSNLQWSQHYCEELQLIRVTFDLFQYANNTANQIISPFSSQSPQSLSIKSIQTIEPIFSYLSHETGFERFHIGRKL